MYADSSSGRKRSVMDRLGSGGASSHPRSDDAKRYRQADGTWRRELYQDLVGTQSSSELSSRSCQANINSNLQPRTEVGKKSSVPDIREILSGVQHPQPQLNSKIQIPKHAPVTAKSDKPVKEREAPAAEVPTVPKKVSVPAPSVPKLSQEKPDASLENLLKSLDLEKYLINFQAEEVDMKALIYMNEEDMKSLGIPMGPRKKILQALASKKRKSSKSSPAS